MVGKRLPGFVLIRVHSWWMGLRTAKYANHAKEEFPFAYFAWFAV